MDGYRNMEERIKALEGLKKKLSSPFPNKPDNSYKELLKQRIKTDPGAYGVYAAMFKRKRKDIF